MDVPDTGGEDLSDNKTDASASPVFATSRLIVPSHSATSCIPRLRICLRPQNSQEETQPTPSPTTSEIRTRRKHPKLASLLMDNQPTEELAPPSNKTRRSSLHDTRRQSSLNNLTSDNDSKQPQRRQSGLKVAVAKDAISDISTDEDNKPPSRRQSNLKASVANQGLTEMPVECGNKLAARRCPSSLKTTLSKDSVNDISVDDHAKQPSRRNSCLKVSVAKDDHPPDVDKKEGSRKQSISKGAVGDNNNPHVMSRRRQSNLKSTVAKDALTSDVDAKPVVSHTSRNSGQKAPPTNNVDLSGDARLTDGPDPQFASSEKATNEAPSVQPLNVDSCSSQGGKKAPDANGTSEESSKSNSKSRRSSRKVSTTPGDNGSILDLNSTDSVVAKLNLKNVINRATFESLPASCQFQLLSLLPPCDTIEDDQGVPRAHDSAFSNEFLAKDLQDFPLRLMAGEFLTAAVGQAKTADQEIDMWKIEYFEEYWGQSKDVSPTRAGLLEGDHEKKQASPERIQSRKRRRTPKVASSSNRPASKRRRYSELPAMKREAVALRKRRSLRQPASCLEVKVSEDASEESVKREMVSPSQSSDMDTSSYMSGQNTTPIKSTLSPPCGSPMNLRKQRVPTRRWRQHQEERQRFRATYHHMQQNPDSAVSMTSANNGSSIVVSTAALPASPSESSGGADSALSGFSRQSPPTSKPLHVLTGSSPIQTEKSGRGSCSPLSRPLEAGPASSGGNSPSTMAPPRQTKTLAVMREKMRALKMMKEQRNTPQAQHGSIGDFVLPQGSVSPVCTAPSPEHPQQLFDEDSSSELPTAPAPVHHEPTAPQEPPEEGTTTKTAGQQQFVLLSNPKNSSLILCRATPIIDPEHPDSEATSFLIHNDNGPVAIVNTQNNSRPNQAAIISALARSLGVPLSGSKEDPEQTPSTSTMGATEEASVSNLSSPAQDQSTALSAVAKSLGVPLNAGKCSPQPTFSNQAAVLSAVAKSLGVPLNQSRPSCKEEAVLPALSEPKEGDQLQIPPRMSHPPSPLNAANVSQFVHNQTPTTPHMLTDNVIRCTSQPQPATSHILIDNNIYNRSNSQPLLSSSPVISNISTSFTTQQPGFNTLPNQQMILRTIQQSPTVSSVTRNGLPQGQTSSSLLLRSLQPAIPTTNQEVLQRPENHPSPQNMQQVLPSQANSHILQKILHNASDPSSLLINSPSSHVQLDPAANQQLQFLINTGQSTQNSQPILVGVPTQANSNHYRQMPTSYLHCDLSSLQPGNSNNSLHRGPVQYKTSDLGLPNSHLLPTQTNLVASNTVNSIHSSPFIQASPKVQGSTQNIDDSQQVFYAHNSKVLYPSAKQIPQVVNHAIQSSQSSQYFLGTQPQSSQYKSLTKHSKHSKESYNNFAPSFGPIALAPKQCGNERQRIVVQKRSSTMTSNAEIKKPKTSVRQKHVQTTREPLMNPAKSYGEVPIQTPTVLVGSHVQTGNIPFGPSNPDKKVYYDEEGVHKSTNCQTLTNEILADATKNFHNEVPVQCTTFDVDLVPNTQLSCDVQTAPFVELSKESLQSVEESSVELKEPLPSVQAPFVKLIKESLQSVEESSVELKDSLPSVEASSVELKDSLPSVEASSVELKDSLPSVEASSVELKEPLPSVQAPFVKLIKESLQSVEESSVELKDSLPSVEASSVELKDSLPSVEASSVELKDSLPSAEASSVELKDSLPSVEASAVELKYSLPSVEASSVELSKESLPSLEASSVELSKESLPSMEASSVELSKESLPSLEASSVELSKESLPSLEASSVELSKESLPSVEASSVELCKESLPSVEASSVELSKESLPSVEASLDKLEILSSQSALLKNIGGETFVTTVLNDSMPVPDDLNQTETSDVSLDVSTIQTRNVTFDKVRGTQAALTSCSSKGRPPKKLYLDEHVQESLETEIEMSSVRLENQACSEEQLKLATGVTTDGQMVRTAEVMVQQPSMDLVESVGPSQESSNIFVVESPPGQCVNVVTDRTPTLSTLKQSDPPSQDVDKEAMELSAAYDPTDDNDCTPVDLTMNHSVSSNSITTAMNSITEEGNGDIENEEDETESSSQMEPSIGSTCTPNSHPSPNTSQASVLA